MISRKFHKFSDSSGVKEMAPMKKSRSSHIRERIVYNEETASQPLDTYYKLHVQKPSYRSRNPHSHSHSEWLRRFQRTHYFSPNYWRERQGSFSSSLRLANLYRQIREAKDMIDYKKELDRQERLLERLTARLARQLNVPKTEEAAVPEIKVEVESPMSQSPQSSPQTEPLVLMIGDEILYDEEYKFDPIWKQDD